MIGERLWKSILATLTLAVLAFVLLLCIPIGDLDGSALQRMLAYIFAAGFWLSVIAESVFVWLASRERKRLERRGYRDKSISHSPVGIISFFKSPEASGVDVFLFLSTITVVIFLWLQVKTSWMIMAGVSIWFLSFNLHCILNGRNYRYFKRLRLYKEERKRDE